MDSLRRLILLILLVALPSLADSACTGASPTWNCTSDFTTLNNLFANNIPGTVNNGDTVNVVHAGGGGAAAPKGLLLGVYP